MVVDEVVPFSPLKLVERNRNPDGSWMRVFFPGSTSPGATRRYAAPLGHDVVVDSFHVDISAVLLTPEMGPGTPAWNVQPLTSIAKECLWSGDDRRISEAGNNAVCGPP